MKTGRGRDNEGVRTRDHLAATRTTLSFFRLGVGLMVLGYGIDRIGYHAQAVTSVALGVAMLPPLLGRHLWRRTRIEAVRPRQTTVSLETIVVSGLGLGALAMLALLELGR